VILVAEKMMSSNVENVDIMSYMKMAGGVLSVARPFLAAQNATDRWNPLRSQIPGRVCGVVKKWERISAMNVTPRFGRVQTVGGIVTTNLIIWSVLFVASLAFLVKRFAWRATAKSSIVKNVEKESTMMKCMLDIIVMHVMENKRIVEEINGIFKRLFFWQLSN
jgi:hypothetical protein